MFGTMGKRGPDPEHTERVVSYIAPAERDWLDETAGVHGLHRSELIRFAISELRRRGLRVRGFRAEERKRR